MFKNTNQFRSRAVRTMCAALLALLFFSPFVSLAQKGGGAENDVCHQIESCSTELKVEIIREFPNVTASCPTSTGCAGVGPFAQMYYKVYLRYIPNNPGDLDKNFNLKYERLNVNVGLNIPTNGYSHIDWGATFRCWQLQHLANWPADQVRFEFNKDNQTVSVDFDNTYDPNNPLPPNNGCGYAGEHVPFALGAPPLGTSCAGPNNTQTCAHAELFTVVVNAFPGETISMNCRTPSEYKPYSAGSAQACNPLVGCFNSGNNNGMLNVTIPQPATYVGTGNAHLQLQLETPVVNTDGSCDVNVVLHNSGPTTRAVTYLEFSMLVSYYQAEQELEFIGFSPLLPIKVGVVPNLNVKTATLRFMIPYDPGTSVDPNRSIPIGTIRLKPPALDNAAYNTHLEFINPEKARIMTSGLTSACSNLNQGASQNCTSPAGKDPPCDDYGSVFTLQGMNATGDCNSTRGVKAGFTNPGTGSSQLKLVFFEAWIEFDMPTGLNINGVNFTDSWGCPSTQCWEVDAGNSKLLKIFISYAPGSFLTLDINPDAFFEISFSGTGCVNGAKIKRLQMTDITSSSPCVPPYTASFSGFPVCQVAKVSGHLKTEGMLGLEGASVALTNTCELPACPNTSMISTGNASNNPGYFLFCTCDDNTCVQYTVTPTHNENPLNGVSTYDLVLISKHILGLEPLGSLYKMIAADANKSGSITTFDIVEIRKLILGIYTALPNNQSWRFVDKSHVFPDQSNPFKFAFPDNIQINVSTPPITDKDFVAIKVGDVDNSAIPYSKPGNRPVAELDWVSQPAKQGTTLTVPIVYRGSVPQDAIQMGLRFNPAVLSLLSPSKGDLPGMTTDHFGLTQASKGEIRFSWLGNLAEGQQIEPGDVLFHLTFRVLTDLPVSGLPLSVDDNVLYNAAWHSDGTEYALQQSEASSRTSSSTSGAEISAPLLAQCVPNPTNGEARLIVQSEQATKGRIRLYDAYGRNLVVRDVSLSVGSQEFALPEVAGLAPGVYLWKIHTPEGKKVSGHLIKEQCVLREWLCRCGLKKGCKPFFKPTPAKPFT